MKMPRAIVRFDPLAEMDALRRQFFGDDFLTPFQGTNVPTTDVYREDENLLTVEAHLPNFDEKDVSVNVDEGVLIVQGQKHEKAEDKGKRYMVRESSSSFYRRIVLPDRADQENIDAQFQDGVLKVTVTFKEQPK